MADSTATSELAEALRRLDALIQFTAEEVDEDGDLLVEGALLRADLEAIRGCVAAVRSGRSGADDV